MPYAQRLDLIVWKYLHGFSFLNQVWEGENGVVLAVDFIESITGLNETITKNTEAVIEDTACLANCVYGVNCATTC